jgi:hypothetical protein
MPAVNHTAVNGTLGSLLPRFVALATFQHLRLNDLTFKRPPTQGKAEANANRSFPPPPTPAPD